MKRAPTSFSEQADHVITQVWSLLHRHLPTNVHFRFPWGLILQAWEACFAIFDKGQSEFAEGLLKST